ncbi:hypothetical protein Bca52824_083379 [Brassica carinata]|uniref:Uncharacterized protein n=1 Tax=Brassica carinata TaxID=52824 RepID=A0A8X7PLV4_BRACI|nr:hypothetical protein Bca52824_083379 [Brassica carinata]
MQENTDWSLLVELSSVEVAIVAMLFAQPISKSSASVHTGAVGEDLPSFDPKTWINKKQLASIGHLNKFISNSNQQEADFICKARVVEVLN